MNVFVASNMPTKFPRKLQKPSTVSTDIRETAETFIMDSGIGDDTTNQQVLDLAFKYDADYVIPVDILHEQKETTKSIIEFRSLYKEHDCNATVWYPLQPPHRQHYRKLASAGVHPDAVVLGGIAVDEITAEQKLRFIRDFRRAAPDVYAHGLGIGGGMKFVQKVAGTGLLDSVDCATPEMAGQFGSVLDERLRQQKIRVMSGEGARKRNTALSEFNSWQLQDVWDREANKAGLSQWQD